jgi:creatinine deaminase
VPKPRQRECFVIMPFGSGVEGRQHDNRYKTIIKAAVEQFNKSTRHPFNCIKANDVMRSGSIVDDFIERLATADVVIADLTSANPNVMYELGVRHALKPGTILLAAEDSSLPLKKLLPFDVDHERTFLYNSRTADGIEAAKRKIYEALAQFCADPSREDSPVRKTLFGPRKPLNRWSWRQKDGRIESPLNGWWVERLDRGLPGDPAIHFSIFHFGFKPGLLDPFWMDGYSYAADGAFHSKWETKYLRVKSASQREVVLEYVYRARRDNGLWRRPGFGMCRFYADNDGRMTLGGGYYLAGEERPPRRCYYEMQKLDADLLKKLGVARLSRNSERLKKIIPRVKARFGTDSVRIDPTFASVGEKSSGDRPHASRGASDSQSLVDPRFLADAIDEAQKGLEEGGIPIGSVLVLDHKVVGRGHNRRVQNGSPILHGEMDCLNNAGRLTAADYRRAVLYTTLSPCAMCTGAILLYRIPTVVVGENRTFMGREDLLGNANVNIVVLNDTRCAEMMTTFIAAHPELWNEDIGKPGRSKQRT